MPLQNAADEPKGMGDRTRVSKIRPSAPRPVNSRPEPCSRGLRGYKNKLALGLWGADAGSRHFDERRFRRSRVFPCTYQM